MKKTEGCFPPAAGSGHIFSLRYGKKCFKIGIASEGQFDNGAVVQLVRAPACHAGSCEFESRRFRKHLKIAVFSFCA